MFEKKSHKIPYINSLNNSELDFKEEETITSYTLDNLASKFTTIGILLTELIELELNKLTSSDKTIVMKFLNELCITINLFGLLNLKTLLITEDLNKSLRDIIFGDKILTEFILNITDRFLIYIKGEDIDYDWVIEVISSGITKNKKTPPDEKDNGDNEYYGMLGSLIPEQIFDTIFIGFYTKSKSMISMFSGWCISIIDSLSKLNPSPSITSILLILQVPEITYK